jgi:hypothetical protein
VFGEGPRPGIADLVKGMQLFRRCLAVLAVFLVLGGIAWRVL